jgi:hypothetical protein
LASVLSQLSSAHDSYLPELSWEKADGNAWARSSGVAAGKAAAVHKAPQSTELVILPLVLQDCSGAPLKTPSKHLTLNEAFHAAQVNAIITTARHA